MDAWQRELLERLTRIETQLTERCSVRGEALEDLQERVALLEAMEHRRKGGIAAMCAMLSAAGALGGLVVKFWPFGGH
jgi:hypothetical protein